MPTYDFRCDCGEVLTLEATIDEISNVRPNCLICHSPMRRVFTPVGVVFKGNGWAFKEKKNSGHAAESANRTSGEPSEASKTGTQP